MILPYQGRGTIPLGMVEGLARRRGRSASPSTTLRAVPLPVDGEDF